MKSQSTNPETESPMVKRASKNKQELKELSEMFHKYDLNHDGEIEKTELVELLKDVFKKANMRVDEKVLSYYQFMFDVNGDNAISLEEFILILNKYSMPIDRP